MTYRGHKHIFRHLKISQTPGLTIESLQRRLGVVTKEEATAFQEDLLRLLSKKYLKKTMDGKIAIRFKLDRVYPKRKAPLKWVPKARAIAISSYMFPYLPAIVSRDQADRGICCGMGGAYKKDCDEAMNRAKEGKPYLPNAADIAGIRRAVKNADGTITDDLFDWSKSAEDVYQNSRRIGKITDPEGSEVVYVAQALVQVGISCENMQWPTSRTPMAVWSSPPTQFAQAVSNEEPYHKAAGYAAIDNVADLCAAIAQYGSVIIGITVYENYTDMMGETDGFCTFPDPKGPKVGGHCLCAVGFDDHYIYAISSWGTACGCKGTHNTADQQLHRLSYNYMAQGFAGAYALVDADDMQRMVPAGGAPAEIIDYSASPSSGIAPLKVTFLNECVGESINHQVLYTGDGDVYDFKATPTLDYTYVKAGTYNTQLIVSEPGSNTLVGSKGHLITVAPAPTPTPIPPASLRERILAFLKALVAAFEKRLFGGA
jgi:hypothetical protein